MVPVIAQPTTPPVQVPALRWHGVWRDHLVVATETFGSIENGRDVDIDEAVQICNALVRGWAGVGPLVHGDFSPWNVFHTSTGLALIDWESSALRIAPLFDITHFVVAVGALLRRYSPNRAIALLLKPGSPGWRHLEAVGTDPQNGAVLLQRWLSQPGKDARATARYRGAMLQALAEGGFLARPAAFDPLGDERAPDVFR